MIGLLKAPLEDILAKIAIASGKMGIEPSEIPGKPDLSLLSNVSWNNDFDHPTTSFVP
jgi:hypothetical protein